MSYAPLEVLFLNRADVEAVAPSRRVIVDLAEQSYRWQAVGKVEVPTKIGVHPERANSFLHAMPAWVGDMGALGTKIVTYYPGNYDRGLQDSTAIILLYDDQSGQPLAIMEGMWITFARTAACAAVAAKHLARPGAKRLGLVGCGGLGYWSLLMLSEVLPSMDQVLVASRTEESRERFCKRMRKEGEWRLTPVASAREAVEAADIVVSSTPQQPEPRLQGAWWRPGTLAIPLDYPYAWDNAALQQADRLVTDGIGSIEQVERAGRRPGLRMPARREELADVVAGRAPGRERDDERALAVITGVASTDVTLALAVYRKAREAGRGQRLALD